ncbi:hypothetical protein Asppvi_001980 [Aspergillus pseudoviridinutans]|uniref:NADP-dependent oxidoreductase domain-containing protein n=1 Tax=Aspergillus pseudoviridinutans TaxID=1517512 RepID=A0A9P3BJX4_9EURO|nr:uncharacterized protein Asppvi_001980 [Aspergillus pseudoviridinutans]GIJ92702.1 hypothetical protein Asppvi_001980 [Aspergillus pseudoviridinutans]
MPEACRVAPLSKHRSISAFGLSTLRHITVLQKSSWATHSPDIVNRHPRDEYPLMTKVGWIGTDEFNYSPSWIDHSVRRSLSRLQTSFIDVVICDDIELAREEEALAAVGLLPNSARKV